ISWMMLLATAGITAFYTTRLILVVFLEKPGHHDEKHEEHGEHHELHKPGLLMMAPLAILAVLSLGGGFLLEKPLEDFLHPVWKSASHEISEQMAHDAHRINVGASVAVFLLGAGAAPYLYARAAGRGWGKRCVEGGGRQL